MAENETINDIEKLCKKVAKQEGLENVELTIEGASNKGENFLGDIFAVSLKDKTSSNQLEFIAKLAFRNDKVREMFPIQECYENESYFYSKILPALTEFQEDSLLKNRLTCFPKCYEIFLENEKEIILMENLKKQGFILLPKDKFMNDDENTMLFQEIAKYHALGFALAKKRPDQYKSLTKNLHNIIELFEKTGMFSVGLKHCCNTIIENFPKAQNDAKKNFEKFVSNVKENYKKFYLIEKEEPYTTILHGDCQPNNTLFKYEDSKTFTNLKEVKLIDFQLTRVGSPVLDLSYFFYVGGHKETFEKLDTYLEEYYSAFSQFCQDLECDPKELYPFEKLKSDWKEYSAFGMCMAIMHYKNKVTEKEDVMDLTDIGKNNIDLTKPLSIKYNEEAYTKRCTELVLHMNEIGAL